MAITSNNHDLKAICHPLGEKAVHNQDDPDIDRKPDQKNNN
jgi:hypothetical protein